MPTFNAPPPKDHYLIAAPLASVDKNRLFDRLSPEEQERADRYRQTADQERHILAHALKRHCLGQHLNTPPELLTFSKGEKGKPLCDQAPQTDFNIAHSGAWILFGLSAHGTIGVDVEHGFREVSDAVADYALNQPQYDKVKSSTTPEQAMMVYWTQKEAISKALGLGLSMDFKKLECSGDLGVSQYSSRDNSLRVETRPTADNYLVSVAAQNQTPVSFFKLISWDGRIVITAAWD